LGSYYDKYVDVKVVVTNTTNTSFAQLFSSSAKKETADAIVRVHPRTNLAYGYAVVALGQGTCNSSGGGDSGISLSGAFNFKTTNGGVYSNSCIYLNGAGNIDVNPASAGITYLTNYYKNGAFNQDPVEQKGTIPLPAFNVPTPNCAGLTNRGNINLTGAGSYTFQPGQYGSINVNGAYNLTLNPGLYCISNGFTIAGAANTTGVGVTLYISGGGFTNNGAGNLNLDAPSGDDPAGFWIRGMLIYIPATNTSTIALSGTGAFNYSYQGTVYAPAGQIVSHGASNTTQNAQLVAKRIVLDGAANMNYDGSGGYPSFSQSAMLDMQE
jgi:hypothetical protein